MAVKAKAEITLASIRDVKSTTRYYLLQSSTAAKPAKPSANPPGGSWVKTEPSYTAGSTNSLYFTDLTVFSDNTYAYSDVSLSSSYEAAKTAYNKAVAAQQSIDMRQPRQLITRRSLRSKALTVCNLAVGICFLTAASQTTTTSGATAAMRS